MRLSRTSYYSSFSNPGGVRFGSSEIYDVLEQYFSESTPSIPASHVVHDALAVGQAIQNGTDERVILFVKLGEGEQFSPELDDMIRSQVRTRRSARHVPEKVSAMRTSEVNV